MRLVLLLQLSSRDAPISYMILLLPQPGGGFMDIILSTYSCILDVYSVPIITILSFHLLRLHTRNYFLLVMCAPSAILCVLNLIG